MSSLDKYVNKQKKEAGNSVGKINSKVYGPEHIDTVTFLYAYHCLSYVIKLLLAVRVKIRT